MFCACTIGGLPVEFFVDAIAPGGATVAIRSPKKIGALRVYQELPGLAAAKSAASDVLGMERKRA